MTNNYFRSKNGTYFFNDRDRSSALDAFERASKDGKIVAAFKPFGLDGPWRYCDLIGLMSCESLRRSLQKQASATMALELKERIERLNDAWNAVAVHPIAEAS